jgi:hypothetical protein
MGKRKMLSIIIALAYAASAFAFDPDELNKITFMNSTGKAIEIIFLSPSDSSELGPDIIGADYELANGKSISYFVHYPDSSGNFDIVAIDGEGNAFELYDYKLTDGKMATITFTKKNLNTSAEELSYVTLSVENAIEYEIHYLFISPADSDAWGVDLLDEETVLAPGDIASFIIPLGNSAVDYNVMGVDEDGDEYTFDITIDPSDGDELDVAIEPGDLDEGE